MGKEWLERLGELPLSIDVHEEAADWDAVDEDGDHENSEEEDVRND
jgi:hypothetical protein